MCIFNNLFTFCIISLQNIMQNVFVDELNPYGYILLPQLSYSPDLVTIFGFQILEEMVYEGNERFTKVRIF